MSQCHFMVHGSNKFTIISISTQFNNNLLKGKVHQTTVSHFVSRSWLKSPLEPLAVLQHNQLRSAEARTALL